MLDGYSLVALLLAIGAILLIAELLLPTHGLLGLAGVGSALFAVFFAARLNPWAGLALMVVLALSTPLLFTLAVKTWPNTYIGRRIFLPPVEADTPESPVRVGQVGLTVSELRPMGVCEFDGQRMEAISELGIVAPGTQVRVIALANNRPTVRVVA